MRFIGNGTEGSKDGIAEEAEFSRIRGMAPCESDGSLVVCDSGSHNIKKISFEGMSSLIRKLQFQPLYYQNLIQLGDNIYVKTIVEKPDIRFPRSIYLDNKTNIFYFVTDTDVLKFYNSL